VLATHEGPNATRHPGVTVYRISTPQPPIPTLYEASIIIVGQGVKRGHLGGDVFTYDAGHYLVMTSPMPMLCEIAVKTGEPVLTVAVEIDTAMLTEMVSAMADAVPVPVAPSRGVFATKLTAEVEDAAARLLDYLADPHASRLLASHTIREILFHVLQGPKADALWAVAFGHHRGGQIGRVIHYMNEHFAESLDVTALARMAHMSVATFHAHFKAVTSTSPLQYLKTVRLTRARLLMLQSGLTANEAAMNVGYQSESQFSREFRRFFGAPPHAETVRTLRGFAAS
jgi:AraC-like DNA-binding protein